MSPETSTPINASKNTYSNPDSTTTSPKNLAILAAQELENPNVPVDPFAIATIVEYLSKIKYS